MDVYNRTVTRYSVSEVCERAGLNRYQLERLHKAGLVKPVKASDSKFSRNLYTFSDLVVARDVGSLIAQGAELDKVKAAYQAFMATSNVKEASAIKLVKSTSFFGADVYVLRNTELVDPTTEELVLDFRREFEPLRTQRVQTLESARVAQRVHDNSENAEDWFFYGLDCEDDGNEVEAISAYESSIACDEENADSWVNLGRLHFAGGRHLEAKYCYEDALAIDENHQIGNYNLGILFHLFDSHEKAIEHLKRSTSIPESFQLLAQIYAAQGEKDLAAKSMAQFKTRKGQVAETDD